MPTLLETFDLKDPKKETRQGESIFSALIEGTPVNEYVYAGSRFIAQEGNPFFEGISNVEVIRNKEWKLINEEVENIKTGEKTETRELYKISEDPIEQHNLYNDNKEVAKDLKIRLDAWIGDLKEK